MSSVVAKQFMVAALGAACLLGAGAAIARDGVANLVSEKILVESRDGKVLVHVIVDNQSDQTVYVARTLASDREPFGNLFEVRDSSNGDPLDYIGPTQKRVKAGKDDFVAVKPHSKHRNAIDITKAYAFMPGRHAYQLNFSGNYAADVKKADQLTPVEPESVMFAYIVK